MVIDSALTAEVRCQRFLDVCSLISPIFERYARTGHLPSVVFGVVVDTELVFTDALGTRIIRAISANPIKTPSIGLRR